MIKKTKIKKVCLLITCMTIFSTININKVAASLFGGDNTYSDSGTGSGTQRPTGTATKDYGNGVTASCSWYVSISQWSNVEVDMYDLNGNKIKDPLNIDKSIKEQGLQSILAGTYIGLDVYEEKGYSVSSRYEISATKTYYKCSRNGYWHYYAACTKGPDGKIDYSKCRTWIDRHDYESINGCASGYTSTKKTDPYETTSDMESWCAEKAKPNVSINLTPSYKVSYKDPNDIDAHDLEPIYSNTGCEEKKINGLSSSQKCTFHYNLEDSCINVKEGTIRYIKKYENCNQETEYKISSNEKFWKYFIPLNATSDEGFSFIMYSSGAKQPASLCKNVIEKYDNYKYFITDQNGLSFNSEDTKGSAKRKVDDGCYYQTTITIPIEQKFYNEVNGTTLKGFNFYYKPIEITNPFPNGVNDTSLWYNWNNSSKKTPDLTKSYNEVTYIAKISNVNDIRNYTKEYPYTTWKNMHPSGISEFVEKKDVVTRLTDKNNIYALGCGPWNENKTNKDGSKNIFYQPECDNS